MPLDIGIILVNRGAGGNFLARALTLDTTTVCLSKENLNTVDQRFKLYHYNNIHFSPNEFAIHNKDGPSNWVRHELFEMYFPFTRGFESLIELNLKVIEPVHPNQLADKLNLLGPDDKIKIAIIDNDNLEWNYQQILHKIDKKFSQQEFDNLVNTENLIINESKKTHHCLSTKLSDIIGSDESFIDAYHQLCNFFGIDHHDDYALEIRNSWKKTWALTRTI